MAHDKDYKVHPQISGCHNPKFTPQQHFSIFFASLVCKDMVWETGVVQCCSLEVQFPLET